MSEQIKDGGPLELAVFSGKCLEGVCGIATGFHDMHGKPLRTGDIVITYAVREGDEGAASYLPDGLTAVVSDEWTSYSDGSFVRKEDAPVYFVMGIRSVPLDDPDTWRVSRVKGYEDVIDGEHWSAYGFNYGPIPEPVRPELAVARESKS
ncbi:hypothetical protein EAH75_01270 [Rhodanobacter glycinis]|uniref:hypothetical protein n=1 Tax=Rhodanobacter glycinis TaxID=582702 RepID=UPI0011277975|nr:hypothetical protein [Rhodanobacter glycinis]TPG50156.1 hypothetical protein EAH75_01270 [Rhodanobacter glycinis]